MEKQVLEEKINKNLSSNIETIFSLYSLNDKLEKKTYILQKQKIVIPNGKIKFGFFKKGEKYVVEYNATVNKRKNDIIVDFYKKIKWIINIGDVEAIQKTKQYLYFNENNKLKSKIKRKMLINFYQKDVNKVKEIVR